MLHRDELDVVVPPEDDGVLLPLTNDGACA
jgi:hypothetical protein